MATTVAIGCSTDATAPRNATSPGPGTSTTVTGGQSGANASGGGGGSNTGAGGGSATGGSGGSSIIAPPDASVSDAGGIDKCAESTTQAQRVPLDLFIMLDQSGSMLFAVTDTDKTTKWAAVTGALTTFVSLPDVDGIGVGLQYFGLPAAGAKCQKSYCTKDADCDTGCGPCQKDGMASVGVCGGVVGQSDSCNTADYSRAAVPIAPLPGNAKPITDSIATHYPYSGTPSAPALEGAIGYAKKWAMANPSHVVAVIFATDGLPAGCGTNQYQRVQAVAQAGFTGQPSIPTYAIGIGSPSDDLLNQLLDAGKTIDLLNGIAAAGGTGEAFQVTGNVAQLFLDALNKIRGFALGCSYAIPDTMGKPPDFNKVNVKYTPTGAASATTIPKVPNAAACGTNDGWYYNDNVSPSQIIMCSSTCARFAADMGGKVDIELGCATIVR